MPAEPRGSSSRRVCCAITALGTPCGSRAGFIYQVVQGKEEPLCGLHARSVWGSRALREIRA